MKTGTDREVKTLNSVLKNKELIKFTVKHPCTIPRCQKYLQKFYKCWNFPNGPSADDQWWPIFPSECIIILYMFLEGHEY